MTEYSIYNDGCVVDLAEERMGKGGGDLCVELKVYNSLVRLNASLAAPAETTFRGDSRGHQADQVLRNICAYVRLLQVRIDILEKCLRATSVLRRRSTRSAKVAFCCSVP